MARKLRPRGQDFGERSEMPSMEEVLRESIGSAEEGAYDAWGSLRVRNTFLEVDLDEQETGSGRRSNSLPSNYSSKDSESSRSHGSPRRDREDGGARPAKVRGSSRTRRKDEANVSRLPLVSRPEQEDPSLDADPAWFVVCPRKGVTATQAQAEEVDETEEQFLERVGLSAEQMLADALQMPDHWSLREQPTALSRRHGDGTCVPCYFHFQSQCLFGDKCGCCHHTSHRNYQTLRRFSQSSKIQL
eukprot:symbB.v1.2.026714.t1/scaffold2644.1/size74222/2